MYTVKGLRAEIAELPLTRQDGWQCDKAGTSQEDVIISVFPGDLVLKVMSWFSMQEVDILPCYQVENTMGRVCASPFFLLGTGQESDITWALPSWNLERYEFLKIL